MEQKLDVRPSPLAGRWYPSQAEELSASVDHYLQQAQLPHLEGEVIGVIAPHAGHQYSGPVAGYAFSALRNVSPELVAVVSPIHRPFYSPVCTTAHQAYETPLGIIPVDQEAVQEFCQTVNLQYGIQVNAVRRDDEHSLEIELPFLQRVFLQGFKLLPLMVHDLSPNALSQLGKALAQTITKRKAVLVGSTDLSHFYPQPLARQYDLEMMRRMEKFDPLYFLEAEEERKGFACGRAAVAVVMWAARELGANKIKALHYATSGDVTGDYSQVVGYGAAAILRTTQA